MTYNLSPEEMDKVRRLVVAITDATYSESESLLMISKSDEREVIRLAWQIKEFIQ